MEGRGGGGSGALHPLAGLSAREGTALLYLLMREWIERRQLLAALGVERVDLLDEELTSAAQRATTAATSGDDRASRIAAFVAAAGG